GPAERGPNLGVGEGAPAADRRLAPGEVGRGAGGAGGDLERHRKSPDPGAPRDARRLLAVPVPSKAPPPGWGGEAIVRLLDPPGDRKSVGVGKGWRGGWAAEH